MTKGSGLNRPWAGSGENSQTGSREERIRIQTPSYFSRVRHKGRAVAETIAEVLGEALQLGAEASIVAATQARTVGHQQLEAIQL